MCAAIHFAALLSPLRGEDDSEEAASYNLFFFKCSKITGAALRYFRGKAS